MTNTQGYSRLPSRHKGVEQAPCEIHSDTACSTLGTKGYSRLHVRYKRIQQFPLWAQRGSAGSCQKQRGTAGFTLGTKVYSSLCQIYRDTAGSTPGTKVCSRFHARCRGTPF